MTDDPVADGATLPGFDRCHRMESEDRPAAEAAAIQSIPGATRFDGPIKIADGVLDRFVADAPTLIAFDRAGDASPAVPR